MEQRPIELAKNGAAHLLAGCDAALEAGEIDEAEWHRRVAAVITPVPTRRRAALIERLLSDMVAEGGRLILGVFNEERDDHATERQLTAWGFRVAGAYERLHSDPRLAYRIAWIDR